MLTWKVGVEDNVKGYAVERSTDGKQYTSIGFVPAARLSSYSFTDSHTPASLTYYRVKNVDHDGKFKYSTSVKMNNGRSETVLNVVPTVTRTGQITFQHPAITSNSRILINTLEGRTVRSIIPNKGSIVTPIDLGSYPSGTYVLHFNNGNGKTETFKIIKQ